MKVRNFLPLRKPVFGAYLLVECLAIAGTYNVAVGESSAMMRLGGSAQDLGRLAAFSLLPMEALVGVFLVAGVLADRFRATTILAITGGIAFVMTLFVAVRSQMGSGSRFLLFAEALIVGVVFRVSLPARFTLIRSILDVEDQTAAVALVNVTQNAGRLVGLLGISVFESQANGRFLVGSAALLPLPLVVWLIVRNRMEVRESNAKSRPFWEGVGDVFKYLSESRFFGRLFVSAGVLGAAFTLQNSVVYKMLLERGGGTDNVNSLGILESLAGAVAGLWLAKRSYKPTRLGLAAGSLVLAIVCFGAAIVPSVLGLQFMMLLFGAVTSFLVVTNLGLLQVETDLQFLGRIMALYGLATAMGALLAVLLTSQYSSDSPTAQVLLCSAGSAVLGVLLWRFEKVAPKPS
jgi:Major Facilitator Superfamily